MKVLFLVKSDYTPSSRLRVTDLDWILEENGIEPTVEIIPKTFFQRRALFKKAADYPIVFLQKRMPKWLDFRELRKRAKFLIYDFDDAIYLKNASPSQNPEDYKSSKRERLFKRVVRGVDMVIASTPILAEKVREFAPNTELKILPSSVKMDEIPPRENNIITDKPVIGWTGTTSTLRYIDFIKPALLELKKDYDYILRIMCNGPPNLPEFDNVEYVKWVEEEEYKVIRSFDIGVMPLSVDEFSKGKAAYKLIQYMCLGVPSVCSPVGMNKDVAGNDEFCLTANSNDEFVTQLKKLLDSQETREHYAEKGKQLVAEKYARTVVGVQLAEILKKCVNP